MKKKLKQKEDAVKGRKGIKSLYEVINVPPGAVLNVPRFEINDNKEVIIDGCDCIMEYNENIVKINTGKLKVVFFGKELNLKYLNPDVLIVTGEISNIEFLR